MTNRGGGNGKADSFDVVVLVRFLVLLRIGRETSPRVRTAEVELIIRREQLSSLFIRRMFLFYSQFLRRNRAPDRLPFGFTERYLSIRYAPIRAA